MSIEQGPFGGSYRADIKVELQVPTWPNKNDTHVKIIRITCTIGNQTVEVLQLNTSSIGAVVSGGGTSKWQDYTCPPTNMTGGWVVCSLATYCSPGSIPIHGWFSISN